MEIKPGKFVVLTYELYAGAGEPEETLMMRATDEMPDQFVYGVDQNILPSMLQRLDGLKEGDKFDFVLTCDEAFGERNEEHVIELDKEIFMVDGKFDDQTVFEGNTVPMMTAEGYRINGSVLKVSDDKVLMDFNHPLAGENLHYVGVVKLVRDATEFIFVEPYFDYISIENNPLKVEGFYFNVKKMLKEYTRKFYDR